MSSLASPHLSSVSSDGLVESARTTPFRAEEYERRFREVRARMRRRNIDALLVTSPENIYYLIGLNHQGYFAFTMLVFPLEGAPVLISRAMERITVAAQAPHIRHVVFNDYQKPAAAVVRVMRKLALTAARVGVEKNTLFFPIRIWDEIQRRLPGVLWQDDVLGIVDTVRFTKSAAEVAYLKKAAHITDKAVQRGIDVSGIGVNEKDIAAAVYYTKIQEGSEFPGFVPLIRSMETLFHEHVTWRDNILEAEDNLFMELSASVHRYHAPLSRMLYISRTPSGARESARAALLGLHAIKEHLHPGALTGDVYAAWRAAIGKDIGDRAYERHHCGYSVGVGFPPSWVGGSTVIGIRKNGRIRIKEGMAFHALSWVFGIGMVDYAISDTVLVTKNGAEFLTQTPRELIVV